MDASEVWWIRKLDILYRERARWPARLRLHHRHVWLFETAFAGPEQCVAGFCFRPGDRMLEAYFAHRWFNIFEVYRGESGVLRGWYVNLSFPARLEGPRQLRFVDLLLDLIVFPQGEMVEVDREEFLSLSRSLPPAVQRAALRDWQQIKDAFRTGQVHLARGRFPGVAREPG